MSEKPPDAVVELTWQGATRFSTRLGGFDLALDGEREAGFSPVQLLTASLAACMAMDVASILEKGRTRLEALAARLEAERRQTHPRRLVRVRLHFTVTGEVAPSRVERAIALSRETYCSVWHSLRPDLTFETSFEIRPGDGEPK
jgi:putative redox protein